MKLIYDVQDKPKFSQVLIFAFQQLLAILAATIAVPAIVGNGMSQSAALFGAGVGTLVYLAFTKMKSPVFLGSSFAFLGSMFAAFAGAVSVEAGYAGIVLGAIFAGLVYVAIAIAVKFATNEGGVYALGTQGWIGFICALVTLFTVMICSVYGKKMAKLIPFVIGILSGYAVATIFTVIGINTGNDTLKIIDFSAFSNIQWYPDFTFLKAAKGLSEIDGKYIATIAVAYIPVAFVVFAEHIADHKNLSSIIDKELLEEPGLHRTLLGDGVGSIAGAFFGGCPNTTYGESVGCVAITKNASIITILVTAILAIVFSFIGPFVTFLSTIPACVMGGVCITLYGFIAVSGLKMIQNVNLNENKNLFVVAIILITGIGGMTLKLGQVTLTEVACALILGIITNLVLSKGKEQE